MKFVKFEKNGRASYGAVKDGGLVDLGGSKHPTLRALLAADAVGEARAIVQGAKPGLAMDDVRFLPVIPDPAEIIAIGLNYKAHALEGGHQLPQKPVVFTRFADSLVGHKQPLVRPRESSQFDYEVELCVIIGKSARRVAAKDALACVAGYAVFNDGSIRDWQRHSGQYGPGKNFYHSGAVGPWMVTSDEIPDPAGLRLTTSINGRMLQDSNTSDLIFDVPALIEYVSAFTPLAPGDMIATGTPSGVGTWHKPPIFLKPGDIIDQEIEKIGVLSNSVIEG